MVRDHIRLSSIGFGCAPIMGKVGKSQAMRAMSLAFDLGVTHFDVARSYGFGRAEYVVGEFLKGKRDKITVTSKFGVVPPNLSIRTKAMIPVARIVASMFPQLKAKLKSKSGQLLAEHNFDVKYARQCLDHSLSALGTDYIDIFLIHEPCQVLLENSGDLCEFLENSVRSGKVRRWGFGFGSIADFEWASALGGDIVQFEGNIGTLPSCGPILADTRQRIVTRPFMGGLSSETALELFLKELELTSILQELDASIGDVSLCLARYLAGESGSVLCSMFSNEHIERNVRAINRLSDNPIMNHIIDTIVHSVNRVTPTIKSIGQ